MSESMAWTHLQVIVKNMVKLLLYFLSSTLLDDNFYLLLMLLLAIEDLQPALRTPLNNGIKAVMAVLL